jgi:hypothetical protein
MFNLIGSISLSAAMHKKLLFNKPEVQKELAPHSGAMNILFKQFSVEPKDLGNGYIRFIAKDPILQAAFEAEREKLLDEECEINLKMCTIDELNPQENKFSTALLEFLQPMIIVEEEKPVEAKK